MSWHDGGGPRRFASLELSAHLSHVLLPRLQAAHDVQPFTLREPREGLRRIIDLAEAVGLAHRTIRGSVVTRGVEVDHIWLAVADSVDADLGRMWVVDLALPLHLPTFIELLGGYVAGDVEADVLDEVVREAPFEHRVVGRLPAGTAYHGEPIWSATRRQLG